MSMPKLNQYQGSENLKQNFNKKNKTINNIKKTNL